MMPRCGEPHPKYRKGTCTKRPGHGGPHQIYWRDALYTWRVTPVPADLATMIHGTITDARLTNRTEQP